MTGPVSQCLTCAHFNQLGPNDIGWTCAAFPVEIPDEVATNAFDHRLPVEGDGGIRWAPLDDSAVHPSQSSRARAVQDRRASRRSRLGRNGTP